MLTDKRKQRNRKQLLLRIYIVIGVLILGGMSGFFVSQQLFFQSGYLSPLSQIIVSAVETSEESAVDTITAQFTKEEMEISSIKKQDHLYFVLLTSGEEIVISSQKDIDSQISSLHFIIKRLTMEGRRIKKLDMSFDKPVVIFE